jgi:hypothetical protein
MRGSTKRLFSWGAAILSRETRVREGKSVWWHHAFSSALRTVTGEPFNPCSSIEDVWDLEGDTTHFAFQKPDFRANLASQSKLDAEGWGVARGVARDHQFPI